ncbi:MAG: hypothetical protein M0Q94_02030 [Candidatus Cloacimonetes bacterium]|nr:hypothetical protein [Candidatus Cloacimonadota bacterium]
MQVIRQSKISDAIEKNLSLGNTETMNSTFEKARTFVYRNARPLDAARFEFLFENGPKEQVLKCLACYQNPDGGFGHALEMDCLNPNSSPMQTWAATDIIRELGITRHPIIDRIISYLESKADFSGSLWYKSLASNKEYPHAPWWETDADTTGGDDYNPSASLAGFLVRYSPEESSSFKLGLRITEEAEKALLDCRLPHQMNMVNLDEMREDLESKGMNTSELEAALSPIITEMIEHDTSLWGKEYVDMPSWHIQSSDSPWLEPNRAIAEAERAFLIKTQLEDGSWPITWTWKDYPEQWAITKNWWKSERIIRNLRFIRALN